MQQPDKCTDGLFRRFVPNSNAERLRGRKEKAVHENEMPFLVQISQGQVTTVDEMTVSGFQGASYKVK